MDRNQFLFNLDSMNHSEIMKYNLVELQVHDGIRMEFELMQLDMFWYKQFKTCPQLAERALEVCVPFETKQVSTLE